MAIDVNKVYRTVLSILNKEQRGYLTPDQFNRLARQSQLDLLEKSFYDYNRHLTRRNIQGINSEYGDIADNIQEKIDVFSRSKPITLSEGEYDAANDKIYKLVQVTNENRDVQVEAVKKSELTYLNASKLTAPTADYPVYYYQDTKIKVAPITLTSLVIDYIKVPEDPKWNYTGSGTSAYTYTPTGSQNFELHPSEEPNLITKILAYAGVIIKDPMVIQMAQQQEVNTFNQENS